MCLSEAQTHASIPVKVVVATARAAMVVAQRTIADVITAVALQTANFRWPTAEGFACWLPAAAADAAMGQAVEAYAVIQRTVDATKSRPLKQRRRPPQPKIWRFSPVE